MEALLFFDYSRSHNSKFTIIEIREGLQKKIGSIFKLTSYLISLNYYMDRLLKSRQSII